MDRQAAEATARRHAEDCDQHAGKERELARWAQVEADLAQEPDESARLEELARFHDEAAAHQTKAATYYRELAGRIAARLVAPGNSD